MNRRWTDDQLRKAVSQASNINGICRILDRAITGAQHKRIRTRIRELGLEINNKVEKAKYPRFHTVPLEEILVEDSCFSSDRLKKRLLKTGLLREQCSNCGLGSEWNGEHLSLHLDHKNGKRSDNRIENLRILCPNCHSQTKTYAGRKNQKLNKTCCDCGTSITPGYTRCRPCALKLNRMSIKRKSHIDWPPTEYLKVMVQKSSYSAVGRELGVSDNAVRKRIKTHPNG